MINQAVTLTNRFDCSVKVRSKDNDIEIIRRHKLTRLNIFNMIYFYKIK